MSVVRPIHHLEPIRRVSVADHIREQILPWLYGDLGPGAKLPSERELCDAMQVSRSAIREVLQGLVMEKILETRQGGGYFVREVGPRTLTQSVAFSLFFGSPSLDELHEAREILEVQTARLAAKRATPDELLHMDELLDETGLVVRGGGEAFELGWAFHEAVSEASHNEALHKLFKVVGFLVSTTHRSSGRYEEYPWPADVEAHRGISQLIRERDEGGAARAMQEHLHETYRSLSSGGTVCDET